MKESGWILAGCLLAGTLSADVFSLWPFSGRGGASGVDNALQGELLWTEEISVNGRKLDLEVTLVHRSLKNALLNLRGLYQNGSAAMNSNSLLFEVPLRSGAKKRYYLVELDGIKPLLQFTMVLPAQYRKGTAMEWPAEFPLPPGAQGETVMEFPKRGASYGVFRSPYSPAQTLADLKRQLENRGWKSAGAEGNSSQGSGEIFIRERPAGVLIVSVREAPSDARGTAGTLYFRRTDRP